MSRNLVGRPTVPCNAWDLHACSAPWACTRKSRPSRISQTSSHGVASCVGLAYHRSGSPWPQDRKSTTRRTPWLSHRRTMWQRQHVQTWNQVGTSVWVCHGSANHLHKALRKLKRTVCTWAFRCVRRDAAHRQQGRMSHKFATTQLPQWQRCHPNGASALHATDENYFWLTNNASASCFVATPNAPEAQWSWRAVHFKRRKTSVSEDFFKQLCSVANPNAQRRLFFLAHEATNQISMVMPAALRCSAQININNCWKQVFGFKAGCPQPDNCFLGFCIKLIHPATRVRRSNDNLATTCLTSFCACLTNTRLETLSFYVNIHVGKAPSAPASWCTVGLPILWELLCMSLAVVLHHVRNIYKPAHPVVIVLVHHACKQLLVDLCRHGPTRRLICIFWRKKSGGQYLLAAHDVVSGPNNVNDATAGPQCEETASTNCALRT